MVVKHNITAMNSNRMLGLTTSSQAKSTEKLSSGYKINRAADDAAGLAISEKMRKQIRGLTQASANAQDGISAVQTAEGALNEVQDMLQRMNELSVKAANGTMSESDREAIQNEVDQLTTEIDRVSETTKFNETYLLKGDQNVSKVATYTYGNYVTAKAATVVDAAGNAKIEATNKLAMTVTFVDTAKQDDQNALAKALVSQGANLEYNASFPTGGALAEGYKLTLNGSAGTTYTAVATAADTFAIQDANGATIANIKASFGGTKPAEGDPDVNLSATLTGAKATAANVKGEIAAIYDKDGNKIAANALDKYFAIDEATKKAAARVDAPDAYDALGNKIKLSDFVKSGSELVSGAKDLTGALTLSLHVGADATSNNQISVNLKAMSAKGLGVNGLKVNGADDTNALNAIDTIKEAVQKVSDQRAELGAVQNRLEHTISNLDNVVENTTSAEAQIRDTDIATEMVKYSNNNILQQAGTSMLSQANQSNQLALSLLG